MMELVLTRLRDFSCKTSTLDGATRAGGARHGRDTLDIQSALAWLREELMEMRSRDQALIRQLMELHSGIQELKLELSEGEEEEEGGSCWDSEGEEEAGPDCERARHRRSSLP